MKASPCTYLALVALLAATAASAQLKLPNSSSRAVPAPAAAAAAPAPAAAPGGAEADKEAAAQLAAAGWLILLDRHDWGRAWESTSAVFRTSVALAAWMDGIPKARDPMGALVERTPDEAIYRPSLEGRPDGDYVTVIFNSKFAARPDAKEIVTMVREPDGKWRATGYSTR